MSTHILCLLRPAWKSPGGYTDALKHAWDGAVEVERALGVTLR